MFNNSFKYLNNTYIHVLEHSQMMPYRLKKVLMSYILLWIHIQSKPKKITSAITNTLISFVTRSVCCQLIISFMLSYIKLKISLKIVTQQLRGKYFTNKTLKSYIVYKTKATIFFKDITFKSKLNCNSNLLQN